MQGIECVSMPYPAFFGKAKPSDHLPVVVRAHRAPRPRVAPLARAYGLAADWKELALAELHAAKFGELSDCQRAALLPILLHKASLSYRRSLDRIDATNDELGLYYASRCLRCALAGNLSASYHIVHRAPHWKMHHLQPEALISKLSKLVCELRIKVWTARSKASYEGACVGGVLSDIKDNRRAKVQRWSSVLAAWRGAFKQSTHRALVAGSEPIVEPAKIADALSCEWRAVFEEPAPPPLACALEAFLAHAPSIDWPPQPIFSAHDVTALLARCPPSAPGPDGVHYLHLAALGAPIAEHLASLGNRWIEHGLWASDFKHSFLVPLPKSVDEPWTPSQTRPISLANTSGKILMRLLAGSLFSCLSSVIVRTKHGFLPGRQLGECVIELEAACLSCAPTHPGAAAIFLDIRKAFDSLDLEFLFALLERTGAPEWLTRVLRAAYADTL